ncbi:hypothetical protein [Halopiger aswanensis]|uniref:Uncharacterized protein n=1 Tax=Halopiger aswanensis TaxID=148449 RepID=A0A3R7FWI3_9EURY|nr:hypothetical protein [Halopiger aswanensis]RKD95802.1 hypothetical protein ATJ93_2665 [Halopiger aswanensis]
MGVRVHLSDWDAVREQLRRFGEPGDVTADGERIRVEFGSAHVEISRTGRVSTSMPLHDFERDGPVDLVVDHEAGSLTVEGDDVSYTFRRPGG